jgi:S1-C subfamily serine protease
MKRRDFLKLGLLGAGGVLTGVYRKDIARELVKYGMRDGEYDFDELLIDGLDELVDAAVKYETKTIPRSPHDGCGYGFFKGNKLLTAQHIINGEFDVFLDKEQGDVIYKDKDNDLVVVEFSKKVSDKYPNIPLGDSDELKVGHLIGQVGEAVLKSFLSDPAKKKGMKHRKVYSTESAPTMLSGGKLGKENVFLLWYGILPGDSGGPAYAYRDGKGEIVGMGKSMFGPYSEFHKINHIKDKLKKYL